MILKPGQYGAAFESQVQAATASTPPPASNKPLLGKLRVTSGANAGKELELRSEEHTSEIQSLMRISYAVFCLKKKKNYKSVRQSTCVGTSLKLIDMSTTTLRMQT